MNGESHPRTSSKQPPLRQELAAPICIALGIVFRELRLKRRLSMYAVAKLAGVSREMVRRVECHLSKPSLDMAARIGSAFGLRMTQLLALAEQHC
ncbi:MAG: helix-turn-helix transcriptional regulator [Verrucomicrobia bacterium]|nr:helix-turn-helix transcriptional regulator [Verrucomicrobiota bacterium]